jgi:ribonuclease P protein component
MEPRGHPYPKTHRLCHRLSFVAVREKGRKESRGPVTVRALANQLGHCRLGMSIGRHVGNAVRRNRIKRLLREAFRMLQHDFPAGHDILITVRAHEPLMLAEYQKILSGAMVKLHGGSTESKEGKPAILRAPGIPVELDPRRPTKENSTKCIVTLPNEGKTPAIYPKTIA